MPNAAFCTYKKTNSLSCLPAAKAQTRRARHTETAGPWGTDRACGPGPPLPNVAFWTYKKASCLTCLPAAKVHTRRDCHAKTAGSWGTDRACGPRPPRPVFQPPRLTQGALATPKQQGPGGRTGPAGHGPHCLTLLSEPTRKASCLTCLPAAKAHTRCDCHAKTAGSWGTDRACGPRPPLPNVAFWTSKKTNSLSCLPAAKAQTRRARHTETARPWGTDRACGPRPPLPNVAFWTYKKASCLTCLPAAKAHTRRDCHAKTARSWGTDRACGPRPPRPVFQPPRLTQGALATPKQQGPEGRTGPAGHGPHCLTLLSEPTRKVTVWPKTAPPPQPNSRPLKDGPGVRATAATTCLPAAKAHTGRARHTETAGPWGTDGACGPRPPLPNVAFWTYKKTGCLT